MKRNYIAIVLILIIMFYYSLYIQHINWSSFFEKSEPFNVFDGMIKATTAPVPKPTVLHSPVPTQSKIANILPNVPILTRGPIVDTKDFVHYDPKPIGPMIHVDRNPLYSL